MRKTRLTLAAVVVALTLAGSASAAPRLYVADYFDTNGVSVSAYDRAADGSLTTLPGSPFDAVAGPSYPVSGMFGLGFTPDGSVAVSSYLFDGGISSATVAADGSLSPVGATGTPSVTGLAVSPDGRFAYVPTRTFGGSTAQGILGFSIGGDGSLSPLATSPFGGASELGDIAITPDGRFLFANDGTGLRRFSVAADGSLSELMPAASTPSNPLSLQVSPDGRNLFTVLDGSDDSAASYAIGEDGGLTPNGAPVELAGASVDYFDVTPDGRHLYFPDSNSDQITRVDVAANGTLAAGGSTAADGVESVGVSPDGRYLYLASLSLQSIQVASIKPDGSLEILPSSAVWDGSEPERLVFQPSATPVASFTASAGQAGSSSGFDAAGSTGAARYEWNFGDGTTLEDGGPAPTHTYPEAGTYTVQLEVRDAQGCSTVRIYTGQTTKCPGGAVARTERQVVIEPVPVRSAPVLTGLRVTKKKISVKAKRRARRTTEFRYRLSETAAVRITARRKVTGRRVAGRCRPATGKNRGKKPCVLRFKAIGSIRKPGVEGANRTRFTGMVTTPSGKRVRLKPGVYRMTAVATDAEGLSSKPASVKLKVRR